MSTAHSDDGRWGFLGTRGRTFGRSCSPVLGRSVCAIVLILSSSAAYADPVRIVTAGVADAHEGDSTFALVGSDFGFSGEAPGRLGAPLDDCVIFICRPGDVVDLSTSASPNVSIFDATTATFDGRTYENVFLTGELFFNSTSVVTPNVPLGGRIELFAPFSMTGHMSAFDNVALIAPVRRMR